VNGDVFTISLNPAKSKKYYVRLTDAESVRIYDSIVFVPLATFSVKVRMDSAGISRDSMALIADMPDTTSISFNWYKLPMGLGWSIGSAQRMVVSRKTAS